MESQWKFKLYGKWHLIQLFSLKLEASYFTYNLEIMHFLSCKDAKQDFSSYSKKIFLNSPHPSPQILEYSSRKQNQKITARLLIIKSRQCDFLPAIQRVILFHEYFTLREKKEREREKVCVYVYARAYIFVCAIPLYHQLFLFRMR